MTNEEPHHTLSQLATILTNVAQDLERHGRAQPASNARTKAQRHLTIQSIARDTRQNATRLRDLDPRTKNP